MIKGNLVRPVLKVDWKEVVRHTTLIATLLDPDGTREKGFSMLTAALKKKLTAHRKKTAKAVKDAAKKALQKKKKG